MTAPTPNLSRRSFLALGATAGLAACTEPLLQEGSAALYSVADVRVNAQNADVGGREITIGPDQVEADIRAQVLGRLRAAATGPRPVIVEVQINRVALVSPGQAIFLGGASQIAGVARVIDAQTGEEILPETFVSGRSDEAWTPGGLLGGIAASSQTPEQDYANTVAGFAVDLQRRLFGR